MFKHEPTEDYTQEQSEDLQQSLDRCINCFLEQLAAWEHGTGHRPIMLPQQILDNLPLRSDLKPTALEMHRALARYHAEAARRLTQEVDSSNTINSVTTTYSHAPALQQPARVRVAHFASEPMENGQIGSNTDLEETVNHAGPPSTRIGGSNSSLELTLSDLTDSIKRLNEFFNRRANL
ncbi:uncharacterized protein EI97DRAFT_458113 [Westerdykella ornata]|uniref:Uncharacterized protein n=1 Tax=Westerdykella ornata TaxID=318751 RepID=A0A6A6JKL8_WESOR|nr:uncharacterized protein EI97DRAFT_458113 [Westerdykella ornata]KAF2276775.1 hypothetical protein EI97DRAFT_458113 [Westerdykella ornata]